MGAQLVGAFGEMVRSRRRFLGLSQTQLGGLVGVSQTHISRIERGGNTSNEVLLALARHLEIDLNDVFISPMPSTQAA